MIAAVGDDMLRRLIFIDICIHQYFMHLCTVSWCCSLSVLPLDAATQPCKIKNSNLKVAETFLEYLEL